MEFLLEQWMVHQASVPAFDEDECRLDRRACHAGIPRGSAEQRSLV